MRKSVIVLTVVAVLLMAGAAFALDTATVNVSATVQGTCKVQVAVGSIAFGTLDPSVGGPVAGTVTNPTVRCTKGQVITVTATSPNDVGAVHNLKSGANLIPYAAPVTVGAVGTGLGAGGNLDIGLDTLSASIAGADYVDAAQGVYSDTLTVTYNP